MLYGLKSSQAMGKMIPAFGIFAREPYHLSAFATAYSAYFSFEETS
jgi:hypothetical protein